MDNIKSIVHYFFRYCFLSPFHDAIDEFAHQQTPVFGIGLEIFLEYSFSAWHKRFANLLFLGFGPLGSVLAPASFSVSYSGRIQNAPDYVVSDARKVFHSPAADDHDGVLL
jgi:hypothetical protein